MKDKIKFIKNLASSMNENKIEKIKYAENNFQIEINKHKKEKRPLIIGGVQETQNNAQNDRVQNVQNVVKQITPNEMPVNDNTVKEEITGTKIESPMVGTFYSSPGPDLPPFVKEGDSVTEGQTLCIVEAMKLMNEVKSTVSGIVKKINVKNGDTIKKGEVLIIID